MAETDPKSVQDLTNVVSRDRAASVSCSANSIINTEQEGCEFTTVVGVSGINAATLVRLHL